MQTIESSGGNAKQAPLRRGGSRTLRLDADLGIEHSAGLKGQLGQFIDVPGKVTLDAAEVERIHTAALQLFCIFCRDRRAAGREVEFLRPSATLRSAAALLGATTLLNMVERVA